MSVNVFFLLSAAAMLRTPMFARWVGYFGIVTAVAGIVGMFRNVTNTVAPVLQ